MTSAKTAGRPAPHGASPLVALTTPTSTPPATSGPPLSPKHVADVADTAQSTPALMFGVIVVRQSMSLITDSVVEYSLPFGCPAGSCTP